MPKFIALRNKTVRVEDITLIELHADTITVEMRGSMQMPVILVFSNDTMARLHYEDIVKKLDAIHILC